MKFENPQWLLGALFAALVGALLVLGALRASRSLRRFGQRELLLPLLTAQAAGRRSVKGVLLVACLAACFVALAQPQYGWGTRRIPATNLDVILALDYSKSMYAQDVAPSRTERAKSEVARLISQLPGARFGAVAFAGEPLSFPLTSDGGAIAQFFRQLSPHDMPVGGTAIARALEAGRALLERDPRSAKHRKVIVLVTDGEDLEGDPVQSAEAAKAMGVSIFVVQIGGRAAEILPDIDENGVNRGVRRDRQGKVITTSLSAEGEKQLTQIAEVSGGYIIRTEAGTTGIDEVARRLRVMMTQELSERVETVYSDVYAYPLGVGLLLLLLEAGLAEAVVGGRRRWFWRRAQPSGRAKQDQSSPKKSSAVATLVILLLATGCESRWVNSLFERNAPAVDEAVHELQHGDAGLAHAYLAGYLGVAPCVDGQSGAPVSLDKPQASFDLGLTLFELAESYGERFGQAEGPTPGAETQLARRSSKVSCALGWVQPLVQRHDLPVELRAQAAYLLGNLEFLRGEYETAVESYDKALGLIPGSENAEAENVGRDAAHNRAIALKRAEQRPEPPEPPDAGAPPPSDGGTGQPESGDGEQQPSDSPDDQPEQKPSDEEKPRDNPPGESPPEPDSPDQNPSSEDSSGQGPQDKPPGTQPPPGEEQGPAQPPPPNDKSAQGASLSQDDRILDQLERAPTVQQAAARARRTGVRRGADDK